MARTVSKKWQAHLLNFLFVAGPGIIVMAADNDAGSVSTYTQAGAFYGPHLLWLMILLLPVTFFVQEMVVRLGIATGKGHAAMIYTRFGKWWGRFSLFDLLLVNFLTLVTEFAAIRLSLSAFGIPPALSVLVAAVALIVLVAEANYITWERITLFLCAIDGAWVISAILAAPHAPPHTWLPIAPEGGILSNYVFLMIAIVGTTVAPWQLFFQQACIADKRLRFSDIAHERLDTFIGAVFTIGVAICMMLVGNFAFEAHLPYADPAQLANVLGVLKSPLARTVILILTCNAALLGCTAISLSSAWAFGEVAGWPSSLNLKWQEAKGFYGVFALCVLAAAGIVLIPQLPLQLVILSVQVLAGIMLPSTIIFLQILLNDKEILGQYANSLWNNIVNWSLVALLFAMSFILAVQVIL